MIQSNFLVRPKPTIQRHSVEVSTAGSYLHIKPSTLETLTRSAANANANRHRNKSKSSQQSQGMIREEGRDDVLVRKDEETTSVVQTIAVLPPALKCLVFLWEELTTICMQVGSLFYTCS